MFAFTSEGHLLARTICVVRSAACPEVSPQAKVVERNRVRCLVPRRSGRAGWGLDAGGAAEILPELGHGVLVSPVMFLSGDAGSVWASD